MPESAGIGAGKTASDRERGIGMKNYMKWHRNSAVVMLISALICMYTGHRMMHPGGKKE